MCERYGQIPLDSMLDCGRLTEPMPPDAPRYNFRLIRDYCRLHGKTFQELTEQEFSQFISTDEP